MERVEAVVEALQAGIWTLDRDGITTYANPRMHEMLGVQPSMLHGLPLLDFVEPIDLPRVLQGLRRRGQGHSDSYDARLRRPDGSSLHVRIQASPIVENGEVIGSVAAVTDVSDLARSTARMTAALDQAEQSATSASRVLSWVSHDLRTPLTTISGFAQLLEQSLVDPTLRTVAGHIQQAATHVVEVARDLLDLAHVDAGSLEVQLRPLLLHEAVDEALTLVHGPARDAGVHISLDASVGDLVVMADHRRVVQVLVNLLSHAIKNVDPDVTLAVTAESADGSITCRVADSHPRHSTHHDEAVVLSLSPTVGSYPRPTGLGLAIADGLARAMGGAVSMLSDPAGGCTFALVLPAADHHHAGGPSLDRHAARPSGPRSMEILYVEDEPLNAALVANIVELLPGRTLRVATNVAEGLAAVQESIPALVIVDLNLPDGSGFDVLGHVRSQAHLADLPVFILSADATQESVRRAMELGANRYITKPFDLRQFLDLLAMATHV